VTCALASVWKLSHLQNCRFGCPCKHDDPPLVMFCVTRVPLLLRVFFPWRTCNRTFWRLFGPRSTSNSVPGGADASPPDPLGHLYPRRIILCLSSLLVLHGYPFPFPHLYMYPLLARTSRSVPETVQGGSNPSRSGPLVGQGPRVTAASRLVQTRSDSRRRALPTHIMGAFARLPASRTDERAAGKGMERWEEAQRSRRGLEWVGPPPLTCVEHGPSTRNHERGKDTEMRVDSATLEKMGKRWTEAGGRRTKQAGPTRPRTKKP